MTELDPIRRRILLGSLAGASTLYALPGLAQSSDEAAPREVVEMAVGDPDAPVTVIEYASFTCPHCRSFHETVYPQIKKNFVDTGKVRFVMREVYFDRLGLWAGMIARCAGEDRYFGVIDILFETQQEWTAGGQSADVIKNLFSIGRQAGLDDTEMEACMQDGDWAEALVADYQKNAEADDVQGTPSFVIDGEKFSNMGYDEFESVLNDKLAS